MSEQQGFYCEYDLTKAQRQLKAPAAHQHEALDKLHKWFEKKHSDAAVCWFYQLEMAKL